MEVLHAHHRLPRGMPARRCHLRLSRLPAAGTCSISSPRSRTLGKKRGRRHPLAGLLAVGIAAGVAGSKSFAAIGQWAADAGPDVLAVLGAARGSTEESTFRRASARISADVLDRVLCAWLHGRAGRRPAGDRGRWQDRPRREGQRRQGPAPNRGPGARHRRGPRADRRDAKSNEIPAVREMLDAFDDMAGAVLTIDTIHTQHDTAQLILARHAD
jgi:hypothetical protein